MLKYELNINNIKTDNVKINLSHYNISDIDNALYPDKDILYCFYIDSIKLHNSDRITIIKNTDLIDNDILYNYSNIEETKILKVNEADSLFTCLIDRFNILSVKNIIKNDADNKYQIIFNKPHLFDKTSKNINLYINIGASNLDKEEIKKNSQYLVLKDCKYINNYILEAIISNKYYTSCIANNSYFTISVYRLNLLHDNLSRFTIYTKKVFTTLNIPFSNSFNTDILKEHNINDFIEDEKEKSINNIIEMEKQAYHPIVLSNNGYTIANSIKINLHFRQHRGDNWQCSVDSFWNGVDSDSLKFIPEYFSYENKSNQSDLVYYADFTDLDIKYQKNKVKKSFLRFTFYDSKDLSNQTLLAYSTVFINSGKLFSKYMEHFYDYPYKKIKEKDIIGNGECIKLTPDKNGIEYIDDINWNTSDYILLEYNDIIIDTIIVNNGTTTSESDGIVLAVYDKDYNFINSYYYDIDKKITLNSDKDEGYKYIRICYPVINLKNTYVKFNNGGSIEILWKPLKYEYITEKKLTGIRNDREPGDELISNKDPYGNIIKYNDDDIEKYRLSTQFIIKDKYNNDSSSEGFYIYLWKENEEVLPKELYMKIEYNNAEYGRTIPLMMPFKLENEKKGKGIKTFEEILDDWSNGNGYSINKYMEYSYIKLKYKFNIETNEHVYYLDEELYGNSVINDNNEIILNLYEAKII